MSPSVASIMSPAPWGRPRVAVSPSLRPPWFLCPCPHRDAPACPGVTKPGGGARDHGPHVTVPVAHCCCPLSHRCPGAVPTMALLGCPRGLVAVSQMSLRASLRTLKGSPRAFGVSPSARRVPNLSSHSKDFWGVPSLPQNFRGVPILLSPSPSLLGCPHSLPPSPEFLGCPLSPSPSLSGCPHPVSPPVPLGGSGRASRVPPVPAEPPLSPVSPRPPPGQPRWFESALSAPLAALIKLPGCEN